MAEQLLTGSWKSVKVTTNGSKIRIFSTQEEAEEWEKP